jgi:hypothetical protein
MAVAPVKSHTLNEFTCLHFYLKHSPRANSHSNILQKTYRSVVADLRNDSWQGADLCTPGLVDLMGCWIHGQRFGTENEDSKNKQPKQAKPKMEQTV